MMLGEAVGTLDIEKGTYTMEEVKAPAGYAVSDVCWILKFGSKGSVPEDTCARIGYMAEE